MLVKGSHLTYCTNIHPGETWKEVFRNLRDYIPVIKKGTSANEAFGIGLRLSNQASLELQKGGKLKEFISWLAENNCYVFTFNGFPYGDFHYHVVKDQVHQPDWTTEQRKTYTLRLFDILSALLPDGMDGGISTSPISYRYWFENQETLDEAMKKSAIQFAEIAERLYKTKISTGKILHLDIEPEPDGILENSAEVIDYFKKWLIPLGSKYLAEKLGISPGEAEKCLKEHIRICYDVCHFALVYEKASDVFEAFEKEGIKTGKIQLSAALKAQIPDDLLGKQNIRNALEPFVEPTYLHQVICKDNYGNLSSFRDLPDALSGIENYSSGEWRIHFHVPLFLKDYGALASTQEGILDVLEYISDKKITNHLEIETYTWGVLPEEIKLNLSGSIIRELKWVEENI